MVPIYILYPFTIILLVVIKFARGFLQILVFHSHSLLFFRERMHEGVIRDTERQQRRKIENLYILEKQNELTKQLKKELGNS